MAMGSRVIPAGAPGIPCNAVEGFRWMAKSARRGNAAAMLDRGSMYFYFPDAAMRNPAEGYRWLMPRRSSTTPPLRKC
jgi:hypothetical protein